MDTISCLVFQMKLCDLFNGFFIAGKRCYTKDDLTGL